jgi:uroporphyrinogen-III synthase
MTPARPLERRRVIVTRGIDKADRLQLLLEEAGATVLRVPLIATEVLAGNAQLRLAVERLHQAGSAGDHTAWLVMTSETAVRLVIDAVGAGGVDGIAVAVVGPASAAALGSHGIGAALVAPGQVAESLADELVRNRVAGAPVLVVTAAGARNVIPPALECAGAHVAVIEAYRSVMPAGAAALLRAALAGGPPDAITFTSGSTVRHCAQALGRPPPPCAAVCIGPVTAQAAHEAGWDTVITAGEHTAAGVVAATVAHLRAAHPLP